MRSNVWGTPPLVFLLLALAIGFSGFFQVALVHAQPPPPSADDAHARRLYDQYKASQEREKALEASRRGNLNDARGAAYGTFGGLAVDTDALAKATKAAQDAERERERQQKLLKAWDKKFSGRYGDLKETSSQPPLPPQPGDKPYKDKMDMRLKWFPYHPATPAKPPTPGYTPGYTPGRPTPGYTPRTVTAPPYPPGSSRGTPPAAPPDKPKSLGAGIRPPDDYRDTNSGSGGSSGGGGY
ncbi:hypothetical protein [Desulfolutivibrio sp.]|uniref:hypothetical protein n=1 Tax=Desulfolutivibrio sp. TaxID=2773296 RepID=UPI002F96255C